MMEVDLLNMFANKGKFVLHVYVCVQTEEDFCKEKLVGTVKYD